MAEQTPNHWRDEVARESEQESAAIVGAIGEYLQSQLSGIVSDCDEDATSGKGGAKPSAQRKG